MAAADYKLCDVCGNKAFYDSNLNYEGAFRSESGDWEYPLEPFKEVGVPQKYGNALDRLGDWAVICYDCSKTYKTCIVKINKGE